MCARETRLSCSCAVRECNHIVLQKKGKISNSLTRFHIANAGIWKFSPLRTSYLESSNMDNIFFTPILPKVFKNHLCIQFCVENEMCISFGHIWSILIASSSKHLPTYLCALHSLRNKKSGPAENTCHPQLTRKKRKWRRRRHRIECLASGPTRLSGAMYPFIWLTPNGWL